MWIICEDPSYSSVRLNTDYISGFAIQHPSDWRVVAQLSTDSGLNPIILVKGGFITEVEAVEYLKDLLPGSEV